MSLATYLHLVNLPPLAYTSTYSYPCYLLPPSPISSRVYYTYLLHLAKDHAATVKTLPWGKRLYLHLAFILM